MTPLAVREIRAFHTSTASGIDMGSQFVVESVMTIHQRTSRYIFLVSVFMLVLQAPAATAQNKKGGVTVSYESSGSSRVARFKNSNSYHVRVEFSYSGTRVHGSAEASGQDAVFCTSQLFRHVRWPGDFYYVGPNHECYSVGLRPPSN